MGQAKRRGTFEERVVQSKQRDAEEFARRERERAERWERECKEREAAGLPYHRPRPSIMPLMLAGLSLGLGSEMLRTLRRTR